MLETFPINGSLTTGLDPNVNNDNAIFAGLGRVGVVLNSRFNIIDLATFDVTQVQAPDLGNHEGCENWAYWGMFERFNGEDAVLAIGTDDATEAPAVIRTYLRDGAQESVSVFTDLSDMCSFALDPFRQRWVWHYEDSAELGYGSEVAGACDATICALEGCDFATCAGARPDLCDALCTNLQTDLGHCGDCTTACTGTAQVCDAGTCACPAELSNFCPGSPGACVDFASDEQNCGACGTACTGTAQTCDAGICACPAELPNFCPGSPGACIDFASDEQNCGACGTVCPNVGDVCVFGACLSQA